MSTEHERNIEARDEVVALLKAVLTELIDARHDRERDRKELAERMKQREREGVFWRKATAALCGRGDDDEVNSGQA